MSELKIKYGSSCPTKHFEITEQEAEFFDKLIQCIAENNLNNYFDITRMSNGALSVSYASYPIGKIKLQGKKHWMQILKNKYDNETIYGELNLFISRIDDWVKYIKWCIK